MKGAQGAIGKELGPASKREGKRSGKMFGAAMTKALGAAGIAAGLYKSFKGLYKVGAIFDDVAATIQIKTGASGKALGALQDTVRSIASETPSKFGEVSQAVSAMQSTFGQAGPKMEGTIQGLLNASRMVGEDAVPNVKNFGQVMNQWQIPAAEGEAAVDALFASTQKYGTSLTGTIGQLKTYSSILQNAGFSMDESVALFGQLESAGLEVSRLMPGLNMAFRKWSEEGLNVQDELAKTVDQMKNAESGTEALAIATDAFGAEGAQRLTTAVRSGTLNLEDLESALDGTSGAVDEMNQKTMTLPEHWQVFKNNALQAIEPVGSAIFGLAGDAMGYLSDVMKDIGPAISEALSSAGESLGPIMATLGSVFKELGPVIAPLAGEVLNLVTAFSPFRIILDAVKPILPQLVESFKSVAEVLSGALSSVLPVISQLVGAMADTLSGALASILPVVADLLTQMADVLTGSLSNVLPVIAGLVDTLATAMASVLPQVLPVIVDLITMLADILSGTLSAVLPVVASLIDTMASTLGSVLTAVAPLIGKLVSGLLPVIADLLPPIGSLVQSLLPVLLSLFEAVIPILNPVINILVAVLTPAIDALSWALDLVIGWVTKAIQWFASLGNSSNTLGSTVGLVMAGIKKAFNVAWSFIDKWVIKPFKLGLRLLGQGFSQLKASALLVWGKIKSVLKIGWNWIDVHVLAPFKLGLRLLGDGFNAARDLIRIAWDTVKRLLKAGWNWVNSNVLSPFKRGLNLLGDGFDIAKRAINTAWNRVKSLLKAGWNWIDSHVFDPMKRVVGKLGDAFDGAKNAIKTAWDKVKAVAAKPINFVIETVYGKGIKGTFDKLADAVGLNLSLPYVAPIRFAEGSEDHRAQIARAGDMRLWAEPETGGEAYIPLAGSKRGRSTQILSQVADHFGYGLTPFADGGILGWIKDKASAAWDFISHPIDSLKELISRPVNSMLENVGGGMLGQIVSGLPKKVVGGIINWVKDHFTSSGPGGDLPTMPGGWVRPSRGPVTSEFGSRWGGFHAGIDVAGGGPTYAAHAGRVAKTGWNIGPGRTGIGILLNHGGGTYTYYGHNPPGGVKVHPGQMVTAGQRIGTQGATGNVTGTHLHFEYQPNGAWGAVNPRVLGLFDDGGWLKPGHMAVNAGSRPEPVFSPKQWDLLEHGNGGPTRDDMDYLADRIIEGLWPAARAADMVNDLASMGPTRRAMR